MIPGDDQEGDDWAWWNNALNGVFGPRTSDPETGYYRTRLGKKAPFVPVVYWWDEEGHLFCELNYRLIDQHRAGEIWQYCSRYPVSHEAYLHHKRTGLWPDESPARAAIASLMPDPPPRVNFVTPKTATPEALGAPLVGHNRPPAEGSYQTFREALDALLVEARLRIAKGPAETKDQADQAADLADKLTKVARSRPADWIDRDPDITPELREAHERYLQLERRWKEAIKEAGIYTELKSVVVLPYLARARKEQDEARAAAVQIGGEVEARKAPLAGGARGRKIALKVRKVAVVEDWNKAVAYFVDNPALREVVQRLANASVAIGQVPPGCAVKEEQVAS